MTRGRRGEDVQRGEPNGLFLLSWGAYVFVSVHYALNNTGQQKKTFFFQNALEFYTYSGAEWCPKHDVAFRFSLN